MIRRPSPPSVPAPLKLNPPPWAWERIVIDYVRCELSEEEAVINLVKLTRGFKVVDSPIDPIPVKAECEVLARSAFLVAGAWRARVLQAFLEAIPAQRRQSLTTLAYREQARSTKAQQLRVRHMNAYAGAAAP